MLVIVTVITTSVSTRVTEAPATTSQMNYKEEKEIGGSCNPRRRPIKEDNAFVPDFEAIAESTQKTSVWKTMFVETILEISSVAGVKVYSTNDITVSEGGYFRCEGSWD